MFALRSSAMPLPSLKATESMEIPLGNPGAISTSRAAANANCPEVASNLVYRILAVNAGKILYCRGFSTLIFNAPYFEPPSNEGKKLVSLSAGRETSRSVMALRPSRRFTGGETRLGR